MFNLVSKYQSFYSGKMLYEPCAEAFKKVRGRMLDVGCGYGIATRILAENRPELAVYGIDKDRKRILEAEKYKTKVTFQVARAEKLPFKDKYFSAVMSMEVIEHVEDPKSFLNEIKRVLKTDGIFFLTTTLEGDPINFYGLNYNCFGYDPRRKLYGHIQKFRIKKLREMLQKNGFEILSIRFSFHYISQIYDTLLQFFIKNFGEKVRPIMYPLSAIIGILGIAETFLLRRVPIGLNIQIVCRKTK